MTIASNPIRATLLAIAAAGALAAPVWADDRDDGPSGPSVNPSGFSMVEREARTQGLRIEEIEMDDGVYEVEGRDGKGREVELKIHPQTGKVVSREVDDDRFGD
ncbi:PepSY domain-containing protein [Iodidimonas sp. SYSU 1G8]|uniref:PepSY domain-containing protein n=1 Tax=Iodidimonas sp. SYSU 1G8 TaxID=3133967 RepID=UPI0031FEFF6D